MVSLFTRSGMGLVIICNRGGGYQVALVVSGGHAVGLTDKTGQDTIPVFRSPWTRVGGCTFFSFMDVEGCVFCSFSGGFTTISEVEGVEWVSTETFCLWLFFLPWRDFLDTGSDGV